MINNIFDRLFKNNDSFAELFRTYLVGAFNLLFGLFLAYIFQFIFLTFVDFPLRIYLTNIFGFMFGVIVSYLISRKIIFQLAYFDGSINEPSSTIAGNNFGTTIANINPSASNNREVTIHTNVVESRPWKLLEPLIKKN